MPAGLRVALGRLGLLAGFLLLWDAATRWLDIPAFILPPPLQVGQALWHGLASGLYLDHLQATLAETLLGFLAGSALGLLLGALLGLSRRIEAYFYPFIVMFQSLPKVAIAPLIVVWFGLGMGSKVVQAAFTAFFPLMVNTIVGLRSADEERIALMRALDASTWQIFRMLRLPNALPYLMAGLEIAMVLSLIGAIVAEFVGAQRGLGLLIQTMASNMDVAGQFSVLLLLSVLGLLLNGLVVLLRRRLLFWERPAGRDDSAKG
jgi:NitT/TauT family transport system permease protein